MVFQLKRIICHLSTVASSVDEVPVGGREEAVRVKEQSILKLGEVLAKYGFAEGEFLVSYTRDKG